MPVGMSSAVRGLLPRASGAANTLGGLAARGTRMAGRALGGTRNRYKFSK